MFILNVWESSETWLGRVFSHPILTPFFSSLVGDKVGHANYILEITGSQQELSAIAAAHHTVPAEFFTTTAPIRHGKKSVTLFNRSEEIYGVRFEHSLWPKRTPEIAEIKKTVFNSSKGIQPLFNTHAKDMLAEEDEIIHQTFHIKKMAENNNTKPSPVNKAKNRAQLKDHEKQVHLVKQMFFQPPKQAQTKNKYRIKLSDMENEVNLVKSLSAHEKTLNELELQIIQEREKHFSMLKAITHKQIQLEEKNLSDEKRMQITKQIEVDKKLLSTTEARITKLQAKKGKIKNTYETNGRDPDFSIAVPTSNANHHYDEFYLDENAILEAMSSERRSVRYNFIRNNCATTIKRCLLAGTKHFQAKMIKGGVSKDFFSMDFIETPMKVAQWLMDLQTRMEKFNKQSYENRRHMKCGS